MKLIGTQSNRDGLGARLKPETAWRFTHSQYQCHHQQQASGFRVIRVSILAWGRFDNVEALQIRWPSGIVQILTGLKADRHPHR